MRHTRDLLNRTLHAVLPGVLALAALAGCVGPLRTASTPEALATAQIVIVPTPTVVLTQPPQVAPTAAAVDCTSTVAQLEPGEVIKLLARVAGCPGLVRVEWRTAELFVPVELLGLSEADLAGLPEEVR